MALHRDIYWVGRQWAVTGYGIQACNQKQKGMFDIEASRLWEDGVLEGIRTEKWLNIEDFEKALDVARKYYPEPPRNAAPPQEGVPGLIETVLKEAGLNEASLKEASLQEPVLKEVSVEAPKPATPEFDLRVDSWPAKFVPQWRIRIGR